ncbi:MAG: LIC12162 family protein [Candidatus Omnitrophota bacterium]|nr:LIC12162 family protein [Candidatus Omnitrophota bacterium]
MKHYLATTAISEIWDYDKELLLLGPWCLTGGNNSQIKKDYFLIPSPWKPAIKIKEAAEYCYQVYRDLLPEITRELNIIHSVSYPQRYWQILIGPWLLIFTKIFYDRYKRLENAINMFSDLYTHILPLRLSELASVDMFDFASGKAGDDFYNFQLFSIISNALMPQNVVETQILFKPKIFKNEFDYNWKTKIFNALTKKLLSKGRFILVDMYHLQNIDKLKIKIRSGYKRIGFIDFYDKCNLVSNLPPLNENLRQTISFKNPKDKFCSLLYRVIPYAIPICYIEGFKNYNKSIDAIKNISNIEILGSALGWSYNDKFKFFAAKATLSNTKLVEFQHGGGYETFLSVLSERIALEKDLFYVWGENSRKRERVRYLPSPHLSRLKDSYSKKTEQLLFIGVSMPKYHYHFTTCLQPEDMFKYIDDKKLFLSNLHNKIRDNLLYRPHYEYGWNELKTIEQVCPNIGYLLKDSLVDYAKKVKLVVIDHPHTSILEALTINVPSVFYWDHEVYLMKQEAEYYFDLLRNAGVVYKDPLSAARKVNEIFDSPLEWWFSSAVQEAREKFCKRYAFAQNNWIEIWVRELNNLAKITSKNENLIDLN